jgi:hypothetical protein
MSRRRGVERYIEPARGATYAHEGVAVYEYGTYPESSVLAGQTSRTYLEGFETVEEASAKYPEAIVSESSLYRPPSLSHLPEEESW